MKWKYNIPFNIFDFFELNYIKIKKKNKFNFLVQIKSLKVYLTLIFIFVLRHNPA